MGVCWGSVGRDTGVGVSETEYAEFVREGERECRDTGVVETCIVTSSQINSPHEYHTCVPSIEFPPLNKNELRLGWGKIWNHC